MNIVIYARYSYQGQSETSIEGQLETCHRYAQEHNYHIINEYIDRGISGRTDHRPAFQKMIADSIKHNFLRFWFISLIVLPATDMTVQSTSKN